MKKKYFELQKILNLKLKNLNLLDQALTHKSYDQSNNYEKLEFLGDRVLGLVIAKNLLDIYPNESEGVLDKKLASLVNKNICYSVGKNLKLNKYVKAGNSKLNIINNQKKIISDVIEALIGYIYIEKGLSTAQDFILNNWSKFIKETTIVNIDSKTRLQEFSLKKFKILPTYKLISNTGPRHNPEFKVSVKLKNTKSYEGRGSSKKMAEQDAASKILKIIEHEVAR